MKIKTCTIVTAIALVILYGPQMSDADVVCFQNDDCNTASYKDCTGDIAKAGASGSSGFHSAQRWCGKQTVNPHGTCGANALSFNDCSQ